MSQKKSFGFNHPVVKQFGSASPLGFQAQIFVGWLASTTSEAAGWWGLSNRVYPCESVGQWLPHSSHAWKQEESNHLKHLLSVSKTHADSRSCLSSHMNAVNQHKTKSLTSAWMALAVKESRKSRVRVDPDHTNSCHAQPEFLKHLRISLMVACRVLKEIFRNPSSCQ